MSDGGAGRPPVATRFRKGVSGNPKGRPKAGPRAAVSAFNVVTDRTLTVTQSGKPREVTVEEALQHKTYQDALAGSRAARREVLKWIKKREQWEAANAHKHWPCKILIERVDPDNANEALLLLGIAERDTRVRDVGKVRVQLLPWAVQAALSRRRRPLSSKEVLNVRVCTRDADKLRWPAGTRRESDD